MFPQLTAIVEYASTIKGKQTQSGSALYDAQKLTQIEPYSRKRSSNGVVPLQLRVLSDELIRNIIRSGNNILIL